MLNFFSFRYRSLDSGFTSFWTFFLFLKVQKCFLVSTEVFFKINFTSFWQYRSVFSKAFSFIYRSVFFKSHLNFILNFFLLGTEVFFKVVSSRYRTPFQKLFYLILNYFPFKKVFSLWSFPKVFSFRYKSLFQLFSSFRYRSLFQKLCFLHFELFSFRYRSLFQKLYFLHFELFFFKVQKSLFQKLFF